MIQYKPFICCRWVLCAIASCTAARADVSYTETDARTSDSQTVIHMKVTPAAEPVPALRYRFIARDIDLKQGNAAPYYYRALLHMGRSMELLRKKYSEDKELNPWYSTGAGATLITELPLEKVREAVEISTGGATGEQLAEATQRRDCDWQLGVSEIQGTKLISFLLEEFQRSREVSRMLALRTRLAIAEHRYTDAIDTMRTNYRLARDFAIEPFLVAGLIGVAEAGITNGTVIELIAAPNSPNLYWALTELPSPFIDFRKAVRFEMDFGPRFFPLIHRAESIDRSPQEWNRLFTQAIQDLSPLGGPLRQDLEKEGSSIVATAIALVGYSHAKQQLIHQGLDRERVERMAVGQVLAIYTERNYQRMANEWEKLWYVPFADMRRFERAANQRLTESSAFGGGAEREVLPIVSLLLPAMQAARAAQVRLERDIAALRVIEALRMYAAAHDGRLPERLDDIDAVPIPQNPATGRPFVYRLEGATAILELPSSDGTPGYSRRFEVQISHAGK